MRYRVLAFLWTIALIAYIQRQAISVPLQEIGRDLELADATRELGLLQSAWYFGYALMQLPAGLLADRIGGRRALVILGVLWSLATAATALSRNYWEILAAWTLMGMLQAGIFPCAVRSIAQVFGDKERARASGWLGAGTVAGNAIAPVLTASLLEWLAPLAITEGMQTWRICLVLFSLPGIVWAVAYWFGTRSINLDRRLAHKTSVPDVAHPEATRIATVPLWRNMCGDRSVLLLCGQQFLRAAAMIFFISWFPTFLRETRGVTLFESGKLTSYTGLGAMVGVILGGYVSDWLLIRTGNRRIARQGLAVAGMSTCSLLIVVSFFITDVNLAIGLISLGAFAAGFGGVAGYTVAIEYGGDRVGTVFGAMNMAGNFGSMLFPVTVGWLVAATGTWNVALFAFALLMAIDAVLWALLNPKGTFLETA